MGKILRIEEFVVDAPLTDSLYDSNGALLMRVGEILTAAKLKAMAQKGLRYLELGAPSESDDGNVAIMEPPATEQRWIDQVADEPANDYRDFSESTVTTQREPKITDPATLETAQRVLQLVDRATEIVEDLGKQLAEGTLRDATPLRQVADQFLQEIKGDSDTTLAIALMQNADQALAIRSVQLGVLSIAIARAMKMLDSEQATAGSAAMLHDMALFELPPDQRHTPSAMRPESRRIYESHPAIAYDMLERVRDIDGTVRIIVLQAHEQADGSGFPRRISITRTHRLARVVNLADAYLTLVGCGPGSQRIFPADAIAYLMHHSCQGRFDSAATCGLVRAVSIYPLNSLVRLSNQQTARVVGTNPKDPTSPIVAVKNADGTETTLVLNESGIRVDQPLDGPETGRRRLSTSDLEKVLW